MAAAKLQLYLKQYLISSSVLNVYIFELDTAWMHFGWKLYMSYKYTNQEVYIIL